MSRYFAVHNDFLSKYSNGGTTRCERNTTIPISGLLNKNYSCNLFIHVNGFKIVCHYVDTMRQVKNKFKLINVAEKTTLVSCKILKI